MSISWTRALKRVGPLQRKSEWGVGYVGSELCECQAALAPFTSHVFCRRSLQGEVFPAGTGPYLRSPADVACPGESYPQPQCPPHGPATSIFHPHPGSCTAPPVTAAVTLCGQEGAVGTEDVPCSWTPAQFGLSPLPSLGAFPLSLPPDLLSFPFFSWPLLQLPG